MIKTLTLALALALALSVSAQVMADEPPNILLILSDDQSFPHLSCYETLPKTPNLDRFAQEGMRFDDMFTAAPQCVPSRASLLTGRSPVAARITRFSSPLPRDVITMPEVLRAEAGYFTGLCRRTYHLDGTGQPELRKFYADHGMVTFPQRVDYLDDGSPREKTKEKVNEFFDRVPAKKPWFLQVSFNDPHWPWDKDAIPKPYDPASVVVPPYLPNLPGVRQDISQYYGEVSRMDEEFQWVLDILKQRGYSDHTLVIFMGDNGWAMPHGKGTLYDPGLHVPCLVRWPGKIKPGSVCSELISGEDISPTCLDAAGLKIPKEMSGLSFLNTLRGQPHVPRQYIFAERGVHGGSATFTEKSLANTYDLSRCVRDGRYKLIYNCTPWMVYAPVDSVGGPGWSDMRKAREDKTLPEPFVKAYFTAPRPLYELYDLEKDPAEFTNLFGDPAYLETQTKLREALAEKMAKDYDFLPLPAFGAKPDAPAVLSDHLQ